MSRWGTVCGNHRNPRTREARQGRPIRLKRRRRDAAGGEMPNRYRHTPAKPPGPKLATRQNRRTKRAKWVGIMGRHWHPEKARSS